MRCTHAQSMHEDTNTTPEYDHLVRVPTIEPPTAVAYDEQGRPLGIVRLTGPRAGRLSRGTRRADGRQIVLSGRERVDIARLVCTIHHDPPAKGQIVMHANDDPSDNHPSNLRWGSYGENNVQVTRPLPLYTVHLVQYLAHCGMKLEEIARHTGVPRSSISRIANRRTRLADLRSDESMERAIETARRAPFRMPIRRATSRFPDPAFTPDPDPGETSAAA